jgi:hypothetical protein
MNLNAEIHKTFAKWQKQTNVSMYYTKMHVGKSIFTLIFVKIKSHKNVC